MELLDCLTLRGDLVALKSGRLIIEPASGADVPDDWLKLHSDELALALATRASIPLYKYIGYTVGSYGKHKADGATLRFVSMTTGEEVYAVYNVDRGRIKDSAQGKAGSKLSGKQFRITEKMALYKLWLRAELPEPDRKYLSEFHRVMGRLKTVLLTMRVSDGAADKNTIQAVTVPAAEVHKNRGKVGDKTGEEVGKNGGKITGIENPAKPSNARHTGESNYVSDKVRLKLISKEVSKDALPSSNTFNTTHSINTYNRSTTPIAPQDQSVDDWLNDYEPPQSITQH